jgi:hypothetical protein
MLGQSFKRILRNINEIELNLHRGEREIKETVVGMLERMTCPAENRISLIEVQESLETIQMMYQNARGQL